VRSMATPIMEKAAPIAVIGLPIPCKAHSQLMMAVAAKLRKSLMSLSKSASSIVSCQHHCGQGSILELWELYKVYHSTARSQYLHLFN
jgi:UDP-N-acetylglucosamine transferase subunit ALG13